MQNMTRVRVLLGMLSVLMLVVFAAGCGSVYDQTKQEAKKKIEAKKEQVKKEAKKKVEAKAEQAKKEAKKEATDLQKQVNDLQKKLDELLKKVDAQNQQNQ